jgi:SSS family solute:Na+ symporter
VCAAAYFFSIAVPKQLVVNLQLMADRMVLQTLPAVIFGLWNASLNAQGITIGWFAGTLSATLMCSCSHFASPLVRFNVSSVRFSLYIGVAALLLNPLISHGATSFPRWMGPRSGIAQF